MFFVLKEIQKRFLKSIFVLRARSEHLSDCTLLNYIIKSIFLLVILLVDKLPNRWWHDVILSYFQCRFSVSAAKGYSSPKPQQHTSAFGISLSEQRFILQWCSIRETSIIEEGAPQDVCWFELLTYSENLLLWYCSRYYYGSLRLHIQNNPQLTALNNKLLMHCIWQCKNIWG